MSLDEKYREESLLWVANHMGLDALQDDWRDLALRYLDMGYSAQSVAKLLMRRYLMERKE